jgi:thiol-disulfide isomerase/thioredoxin
MRNKTRIFIVFLLTCLSCQQKNTIFYKDYFSGTIYTKSEYLAHKQAKSSLLKVTNASLKEYIIEEYESKDSIIHIFKLNTIRRTTTIGLKTNKEEIYELKGSEFPAEKLKLLNGTYYDFGQANNKPTFINIWYTTCKPCVAEINFFNKIKEEYKDRINFVAITFESKDVVEKFLKKKPFNFTQIIESREFLHKLGVKMYPKSIFIDTENIVKEVKGALIMNQANSEFHKIEFKKYLDKLL